jgi:hypothetical protein
MQTLAEFATTTAIYTSGIPHASFSVKRAADARKEELMNNIFYIIGVVVVVLIILGYFGFR